MIYLSKLMRLVEETEANRIAKIHLHFVIKGKNLSPEKIEKAMEVAHKNCAMAQSVEGRYKDTKTFELEDGV